MCQSKKVLNYLQKVQTPSKKKTNFLGKMLSVFKPKDKGETQEDLFEQLVKKNQD
jgi:hypothetical protein